MECHDSFVSSVREDDSGIFAGGAGGGGFCGAFCGLALKRRSGNGTSIGAHSAAALETIFLQKFS
jgi:hypothetical protein